MIIINKKNKIKLIIINNNFLIMSAVQGKGKAKGKASS